MNCFPVLHCLLELSQTHVHRVGDAIQPSHLLSSPSPPTFNLPHHQGLFQRVVLLIRWPKYWSFSLTVSTSKEYSGFISFGLISLLSKGLSSVFSNTTVQKTILQLSAFFMAEYFYLELSNFNIPLLLDNKFY